MICNYGFQNLSDEKLKHNVEPAELEELQQLFDAVAWTRSSGSSSPSIVLRPVGSVPGAPSPRGGAGEEGEEAGSLVIQEMAEEGALEFFRGLAEEFNVRDARKLYRSRAGNHPERRDLTAARARAALRTDVRAAGACAKASQPGQERGG